MITALLLVTTAGAYETDQLTDRHEPLEDVVVAANEVADARIADAVAATNERLKCRASEDRTLRVLSREIRNRTGALASVPSRGGMRANGFTVYSAWMESDPEVDRVEFADPRADMYSDVTMMESLVLSTAGTNSTFQLAGVRMGSDKPEHFWDVGHQYLKRSRWGDKPDKAVKHGVATEFGIYGLATSRTFSWADLAANWAGFEFYDRLLTDDSEVQLADDGCVAQVGEFDWAEWASWEWDEVLNPSQYAPEVEVAIQRHLVDNRDDYCDSYATWGGAEYEAHLATVLETPAAHTDGAPSERWDPYRLDELCRPQHGLRSADAGFEPTLQALASP